MTEVQRRLPPPTFLGSPDRIYHDFRPSLPPLHSYPTHHEVGHAPHYQYTGPLPISQADTGSNTGSRRASGRSIPISALLSDDPPREKYQRTDSLVANYQHTHGSYPPTEAPVTQYAYVAVDSQSSPYGQPVQVKQESLPALRTRYAPPQHPRRQSSCSTPTSTSESYRLSSMLHSPASDQYEAFPMAPIAAPPERPMEYVLRMRQQPIAARACGFGERDRRVVDPPPIVELIATDKESGENIFVSDSYTTMHCVLINAETDEDESQIPPPAPNMASAQRLMGNVVASPCRAQDEHDMEGVFFVFPDLSCRSPGKYRLLFRLLKINPLNMQETHPIKCNAKSDPFEVFTAKEFPGMKASSPLIRRLRQQGLNVGVKKGSEASKRSTKKNKDGDDSDGDVTDKEDEEELPEQEDPGPGPSRPKGKAKRIRSK